MILFIISPFFACGQIFRWAAAFVLKNKAVDYPAFFEQVDYRRYQYNLNYNADYTGRNRVNDRGRLNF
jgi:hypothetical protein